MAAIELHGVTKSFGDVTAVEDLDLVVESGEIFGFLGPNGAGKTTTIDLMLDFVRPTAGTRTLLGTSVETDPVGLRRRTGVLPEGAEPWARLTGRQHVAFAMESKDVTGDPAALLDRVGLLADADRRAGDYSKGMAQRLLLAMALVGEPELLILDEPSTGLDPNGAREMRAIVREEHERGATVFFSSHILEQVEAVCDRVGILREGRLVALDTIDGLRESVGTGAILRVSLDRDPATITADLTEMTGVEEVMVDEAEDGYTLAIRADGSKTAILAAIEDAGFDIRDFATEEASLDDVFRSHTQQSEES